MSRSSYSRSHAKTNAQKNALRNSPGTYSGAYAGSSATHKAAKPEASSPNSPDNSQINNQENPEIIQASIHALSHEGRGIASINGKTTFVEDALPGELVEIEYLSRRGKYDEARAVKIITASPDRVTPPCEYFGRCGGCVLQHLDPVKQVVHKESVLRDHLVHFGKISPKDNFLAPLYLPSPLNLGYRKKARLSVRYVPKKGGALVGFREREGKFLMDMAHCEVLDPSVGHHLEKLRKVVSSLDSRSDIAQIEMAVGEDENNQPLTALVFRNLEKLSDLDFVKLRDFGAAENFWIYLQPKGPDSVFLIYPEKNSENNQENNQLGDLSYSHQDHNIKINFMPQDFTQVNSGMNTLMLKQALDLLDLKPNDQVLDLFCGLGNFTLPMARYAEKVLGIEGDLSMVEKARKNAESNLIKNSEFMVANLFEENSPNNSGSHWEAAIEKLLPKVNKVLLDPPRSGAEAVVNYIGRKAIPHVVYVSCNPATLARDAGILVNNYGYELVTAGVMDMFPHTAHVESMAVFIKK